MKTFKNELIWFAVIVLPVTWLTGLLLWNRGGLDGPLSRLTMYFPALTVMFLYWFRFKRPVFKKGDLGFKFTGWKYWIIAPLVMTAISFLSYGISWFLNPMMFNSAETIKQLLITRGFYFGNMYVGLLIIIALNCIVGSLLNIPMFIGEELGWRGFMTPRLMKLFSPKIAFITGGAIWALWHSVMIAQGLNYPNHLFSGILMMIIFAIPVGIIIQYFYYKSNSIFVAALAHAALNKSAMSMSFVLGKEDYNTFIYGPTGIIGVVLFYLVAIYLYRRIDWKAKNLPVEKEAEAADSILSVKMVTK